MLTLSRAATSPISPTARTAAPTSRSKRDGGAAVLVGALVHPAHLQMLRSEGDGAPDLLGAPRHPIHLQRVRSGTTGSHCALHCAAYRQYFWTAP